jgi:hypothetical protein
LSTGGRKKRATDYEKETLWICHKKLRPLMKPKWRGRICNSFVLDSTGYDNLLKRIASQPSSVEEAEVSHPRFEGKN